MGLQRMARHLVTTHWQVRRAFPGAVLSAVEGAITAGEARHQGEVRFAVEGALGAGALCIGQTARDRAVELFSQLRVWDTEHNNGLLIYVLLADRAVELVADRGIASRVGGGQWQSICRAMEAAFAQSDYRGGVTAGIASVTTLLALHFPAIRARDNELPDRPVVV
jgi:uncharacterized membrane protein